MVDLSFFPYRPREGQVELIGFVQRAVKRGNVCINAPTGFGKTPCILAALLPIALSEGYKILWAVRTGTETDRPIEELKVMNEYLGERVSGVSFRGKRDMCLLAKEMRSEMGYEEVAYLCKSKAKKCKYRDNLTHRVIEDLIGDTLLYSEVLKICTELQVCPYEVQRMLLPYADVIGLNYNYVIHEGLAWSIKRLVPFSRSLLVVDEAHNLQRAAASINSVKITIGTLKRCLKELERFAEVRARKAEKFVETLLGMFENILTKLRKSKEEDRIVNPASMLRALNRVWDIKEALSSISRYGHRIRKERLSSGKVPRSSLHRFALFLDGAISSVSEDGIAIVASRAGKSLEVEVWDMRAEELLRRRWRDFRSCIFCSGTLSPISAFAETVGLDSYTGRSFEMRFRRENIKTLITKDLSTEGEKLSKEMRERYLDAIGMFVKNNNTNLAVFTSSYRVQRSLLKGIEEISELYGRSLFVERKGMKGDESREILEEFKACSLRHAKGLLLAPMQGRFAEGADFPGEELEGIFLVGIPFDRMNNRTRAYLNYYTSLYGKEKGNLYAYVIPALKRASQALGRCLRSVHDRAVFVLGDRRYEARGFLEMLPKYIRETSIVGSSDQIDALSIE